MTDGKDFLEFRQRGVGMLFDVGVELGRVELAPGTPTGLGGQGVGFDGGQIAVNRAAPQSKVPPRFGDGAARLHISHHPFPQIQRVGFHAQTLSAVVPISM